MSQYYYLVTGLPELTLEDNKLNHTVADFKTEFYPLLSGSDKRLVDLFYLQYDNRNLLRLLKDNAAATDPRGMFKSECFLDVIRQYKEDDGVISATHGLPKYMVAFIVDYFKQKESDATVDEVALEDKLSALYYSHAMKCGNGFVSSWFEFNLNVKNILSAINARKFKIEVPPVIVGDTPVCEALRMSNARDFGLAGELDYLDDVLKIGETHNLIEREKKVDQLKWKWMEDKTFFEYFSIERLYVFLLQVELVERWLSLDKDKGNRMFRDIIASFKNDVKVPDEI